MPFYIESKEDLIYALRQVAAQRCAYRSVGKGSEERVCCDCKYVSVGDRVVAAHEHGSCCPNLHQVADMLEHMSKTDFDKILRKLRGGRRRPSRTTKTGR